MESATIGSVAIHGEMSCPSQHSEGVVENRAVRLEGRIARTANGVRRRSRYRSTDNEKTTGCARLSNPADAAKFEMKVLLGRESLTPYDDQNYQPPAPVASLTLRTLDGRDQTVSNVPALLDTGADVTVLPRWATQQLGLIPGTDESIKLAGFDGSIQSAESVELEASFQGGRFQGRYVVIDQPMESSGETCSTTSDCFSTAPRIPGKK